MRSMILAMALAASSLSAATILGLGAEADYYSAEATGYLSYTDNGTTTNTRFGNESVDTYQVGVYFEHPVPLLPNIRLDLTPEAKLKGLDGLTASTVSLDQMDVTPYYEIIDTAIDIDVGVTFKIIQGDIKGNVNQSFNVVIPMGYAGIGVDIPGTGIRIAGDMKYIRDSGDSFYDSRIKASLDLAAGLAVEAGYRREKLDLDRFDIRSNMTIEGPFVGMNYRF